MVLGGKGGWYLKENEHLLMAKFATPNHYPPPRVRPRDKVNILLFHIKNYPPYLTLLQLLK
jgi:hypothetical protein